MADSGPPVPDKTASTSDPGDDTASRYRYQYAWAAVMCCMLLDDTTDVVEVFCEHHEDILIKHRDGRFTGLQVKTRESDQPVWKTNDAEFISSCVRFVELDVQFGGQFREFKFLTNHFLYGKSNSRGPVYLLAEISSAQSVADLPGSIASWLRKVARKACCSESVAFVALAKARATDELPKLRDMMMRLIETVTGCWSTAAACSHDAVRRAATALVDECARASSLDHRQVLPGYLAAMSDSDQAELIARIHGKRMTVARVHEVLIGGLSASASLESDVERMSGPTEGDADLMVQKLNAGGFSAVSVNSAEDLRSKAEYLGIAWTKKHGRETGLQRYNHVRSIVLSDAARSFEETKATDRTFGPDMRENLRARFRRRREDQTELYDSADEHLEGVAYILTAQCKVQWSLDRPWETA